MFFQFPPLKYIFHFCSKLQYFQKNWFCITLQRDWIELTPIFSFDLYVEHVVSKMDVAHLAVWLWIVHGLNYTFAYDNTTTDLN